MTDAFNAKPSPWAAALNTEVSRILSENPDLTQLETRSKVYEELRNKFNGSDHDVVVNPKGHDEIQVILNVASMDEQPAVRVKQRFKVPCLSSQEAFA